jgi:predicted kinase
VWLQAPGAVLEDRVAARRGDASDATIAVLRATARASAGAGTWTAVDAAGEIEQTVDAIRIVLV